ncbi:SEC-C motif-containing protein [Clostridium cochlearium]|uniref:SEC-C motif-containing protein n=1 Tax=Clostridium cochlearium TaxID=1494 RepID=A0ABY0QK62_CLOCO|nr:SEC-C metal-binding domain-containing protein [Clostridium cochlearium]SDL03149.1 SEC-C motif-containing protein [Clostridium cochlearium]
MSLYEDWKTMVIDYVRTRGEEAFWNEYGSVEKNIYTQILSNKTTEINGVLKDVAKEYNTSLTFFVGFLDGLSDSLVEPLDLENIEEDSKLDLNIDLEKLYFNMLDAKADYLYNLPQWDAIFSIEKRKEIHNSWRDSKTVVNENKVGRNDPCPCGSGKKYKKCCGKN